VETTVKRDMLSLERGLDIMLLTEEIEKDCFTISDIIQVLSVPRSSAYRIVKVLKSRGFLQDAETYGTYELGPQLAALGSRVESHYDLARVAMPLLRRLVQETGETAYITVRSGWRSMCLDFVQCDEPIRRVVNRGNKFPLHAGAPSKVVMAHMVRRDIERVLSAPLERLTERTVCDPDVLRKQLHETRTQGYAVAAGETSDGVMGIAVPVSAPSGRFLAALTVSGPSFRIDHQTCLEMLPLLREVSATITEHIDDLAASPEDSQEASAPFGASV
jgi:DNA-binding IclR family transcriptional regulator